MPILQFKYSRDALEIDTSSVIVFITTTTSYLIPHTKSATMGFKKMFKKKDPTEAEIRDSMQDAGLLVKTDVNGYNRNKFDSYKGYAAQVTQKTSGGPPPPRSNPYAVQNQQPSGVNPYAAAGGAVGGAASDPYGNGASNDYGNGNTNSGYGNGGNTNSPYNNPNPTPNPYSNSMPQGNEPPAKSSSKFKRFGRSKKEEAAPPPLEDPRLRPRQYGAPTDFNDTERDDYEPVYDVGLPEEPDLPPPPMPGAVNPYASANQGYGSRFGNVDRELEEEKNELFGPRTDEPPMDSSYNPALSEQQPKYAESVMSMPRQQLSQKVRQKEKEPAAAPAPAEFSESAVAVDEEEDLLLGGGSTLNLGRVDSYSYGNEQEYGKQNYSYNYNQGHEFDTVLEEEEKTEQDQEDEDVEAVKQQIRFTKQQSAASTRNALRHAAEAEESGRNTLGMLGSQGERLYNIHSTLALATTQHKIAEDKAKELKTVTRSMFAPHVSNPFNSKRRAQEKEDRIRRERAVAQVEREQRRRDAYDSQQRVVGALDGVGEKSKVRKEMMSKYGSRPGRDRYQFEADEEDDILEDEIDNNLDELSGAASRLKKLGLAMNEEVEQQNEKLDQIAEQTDDLDISVHLNTARLAGIH